MRMLEIISLLFPMKRWKKMSNEHKYRPGVTTLSGREPEVHASPAPAGINENTGQYRDYWVLSSEERAKGFVTPVRNSYVHNTCGGVTKMANELSETFARDPSFYGGTFCVKCRAHYPVSEFVWDGTDIVMGTGPTPIVS